MSVETEPLYDVVIYERATREIDAIAGEAMRMSDGYFNATKRMMTVLPRLNDRYSVTTVPTGKFRVGEKVPR